jgi:hypothetical protein
MDLKEIVWEDVDWFLWLRIGQWRVVVNMVMNLMVP